MNFSKFVTFLATKYFVTFFTTGPCGRNTCITNVAHYTFPNRRTRNTDGRLAPSFRSHSPAGLVCQPFSPEKAISGTQLYYCSGSSNPGAASHIFTICRRMTEREMEREKEGGNATHTTNNIVGGSRRKEGTLASARCRRRCVVVRPPEPLQSHASRGLSWAHFALK